VLSEPFAQSISHVVSHSFYAGRAAFGGHDGGGFVGCGRDARGIFGRWLLLMI
jgi:hypothetical protein